MEQFKLPIPSLQFLASHAVVRCLVSMKADKAYWDTHLKDSLSECELRVDKLPLPPAPREYVKNVLKGFFLQVKGWIWYYDRHRGTDIKEVSADILVDAHGNIDERRMARHHFEKLYKDELYRADFQRYARFLEFLSFCNPYRCSKDFVRIILTLQKVNASLEGPEYRLVGEELHVVFRFVNCSSVPPEFDAFLECRRDRLQISTDQSDILVTYSVYKEVYDENMFRIHVDLLQPLQKVQFVKEMVYSKMKVRLSQEVFRFLNVLDPETRQNCLLCLREDHFHSTACSFLNCCLIPGYELYFIPMMTLVGLNVDSWSNFRLFYNIVDKIDLIGFEDLPFQFWQFLPASKKSEFRTHVLDHCNLTLVKVPLKKLLRVNRVLFQVLFHDVSVGLSKKQARCLLHVILDE